LTKEGRKRLSEGNGLNIGFFSLSDMGVDYRLWNPDHPSGSAFYGEAIENLPSLEAIPRGEFYARNKLITLAQDVTGLPFFTVKAPGQTDFSTTPGTLQIIDANDDANDTGVEVEFKLSNIINIGRMIVIVGNQTLLADTNPVTITSPGDISVTNSGPPNGQTYQSLVNLEAEEPSYHTFDLSGTAQDFFKVKFKRGNVPANDGVNPKCSLTIIDDNTGIYKTLEIEVERVPQT